MPHTVCISPATDLGQAEPRIDSVGDSMHEGMC